MLLSVTGTLAAIAREIGCNHPSTIHHWRYGQKEPNPEMKARLWSAFGIPSRAWSVRPGALDEARPPPIETARATAPAGAPSTLEDCLALLDVIRRDRQQEGLLPNERVKLASAEAQILALRARLEQAAEFAESRYVTDHPSWIKLRRAILRALEPHPIAAKAVLEAITKIEGGGA